MRHASITTLMIAMLLSAGPARAEVKIERADQAHHRSRPAMAGGQAELGRLLERWPLSAQHRHHRLRPAGVHVAGPLAQPGAVRSRGRQGRPLPDRLRPPEDGYLIAPGARGGNMYCHAMATLALAELWGTTGDDDIKPVLQEPSISSSAARTRRAAGATSRPRPGPTSPSPSCRSWPCAPPRTAACTSPTRR